MMSSSYNPWSSTAIYCGAPDRTGVARQQAPAEEEEWAVLEKQIWAAAEQSDQGPGRLVGAARPEAQQPMEMGKKAAGATNDFEGNSSETGSTTDAGDTTPPSPFDSQDSAGDEEEEELLAKVPRDEHGNLTSIGSLAHGEPNAACKPCVFAHNEKKPCGSGMRCAFCHFWHPPKTRVRLPKKQRQELKRQQQVEAENDVVTATPTTVAAPTTAAPPCVGGHYLTPASQAPPMMMEENEYHGELENAIFSNPPVALPPPGFGPRSIGLPEGHGMVAPHDGAPWHAATAAPVVPPPGLGDPEMLMWLDHSRVVSLLDATLGAWPAWADPENSMRMEPARVSLTQASEAWFQAPPVALPLAQPPVPWLPEQSGWLDPAGWQVADSWAAIEADLLEAMQHPKQQQQQPLPIFLE